MVQMWVESYNTYHLVDGAAMKEAWGAIMPHIMLSEKNLQAILAQVKLALDEDQFGGTILTPRCKSAIAYRYHCNHYHHNIISF